MEKDLIEYIAKSLVDDPSAVSVNETEGERGPVLELRVAQSDIGKVLAASKGNCSRTFTDLSHHGSAVPESVIPIYYFVLLELHYQIKHMDSLYHCFQNLLYLLQFDQIPNILISFHFFR